MEYRIVKAWGYFDEKVVYHVQYLIINLFGKIRWWNTMQTHYIYQDLSTEYATIEEAKEYIKCAKERDKEKDNFVSEIIPFNEDKSSLTE